MRRFALIVLASLGFGSLASAAVDLEVIAATGWKAPGTGRRFAYVDPPYLGPPGVFRLAATPNDRPDALAVGGGRLGFQGFFEDGSSAVVLATLPVPEPGPPLQLVIGLLVLLCTRRSAPAARG